MIKIKKYFLNYFNLNNKILKEIDFDKVNKLLKEIEKLKNNKKKILIFGNGAGASIASHFANDINKNVKIRCLSFDSSVHLTCYANDYGYENWVKETIKSHYQKGDFIILISASGNSLNMVRASSYCKKKRYNYFSITGFKRNNKLIKNSKNYLWINSSSYNQVEIAQLFLLLGIIDKLK